VDQVAKELPTGEASTSDSFKAAAAAAEAETEPGGGRGRGAGQHPMGVVCSCVRTGWSLMSSLFCVGEEVRGVTKS